MSRLAKMKAALAKAIAEFGGEVKTDKGVLHWIGDSGLVPGLVLTVTDENGNEAKAGDGCYNTDSGSTICIADGRIREISATE